MKRAAMSVLGLVMAVGVAGPAFAHCEIPCGIYGDQMRIDMIEEHITTIEKSMNMIIELSAAETVNYNQLVRWVDNKEHHANEIQYIVTQYFMTQRVKPVTGDNETALRGYQLQLELLHRMLVTAMKTKQTTDLEHVEELRSLVKEFETAYFGPAEHEHDH